MSIRFIQLNSELSIYLRKVEDKIVIIAVYMDDLQITSNDMKIIEQTKMELNKRFQITDLGEVNHILGLRVLKKKGYISIDQEHYVKNMLKKFNMDGCNSVSTPMEVNLKLRSVEDDREVVDVERYRSAIGTLNYVAMVTRPDIATAVSMVARFMQKPGKQHWYAVKRIMRYLQGTSSYGLIYRADEGKDQRISLEAYCDTDWAGDIGDQKSISGYVIKLGGTIVS